MTIPHRSAASQAALDAAEERQKKTKKSRCQETTDQTAHHSKWKRDQREKEMTMTMWMMMMMMMMSRAKKKTRERKTIEVMREACP